MLTIIMTMDMTAARILILPDINDSSPFVLRLKAMLTWTRLCALRVTPRTILHAPARWAKMTWLWSTMLARSVTIIVLKCSSLSTSRDGEGHSQLEGARVGGTACGGRERNAEHRERQPERPHYHARREAGRCHQVGF